VTEIEPLVVRPTAARKMLAGCSKATLWRLVNSGKLKSFKEGGSRWISVKSIEAYVTQRLEQQDA